MASTRQIKSRIRSVKSNKQITKAMELVAASKLRRAQEAALSSQRFAEEAMKILRTLSKMTDVKTHAMFHEREIKSRVIILITSDRGLAGAYNANALKMLTKKLREDDAAGISTTVIAVGKKGAQFVSKLSDVEALGVYDAGDSVTPDDVRTILMTAIDMFNKSESDTIDVISTQFINSFTQQALYTNLLPAGTAASVDDVSDVAPRDVTFEPSYTEVLDYVAVRLLESELFQLMLDSIASEHAMRRVAMKNASDNATDIIDDLTLEMNKVRQAGITQELSEISAGVEAMK
ncbi:MAG: ATP synthase F1 subunit gamma [Candidatus Saccharimonadales bacterium]